MILAEVIGTVVATRKHDRLIGSKFLILKPLQEPNGMQFVGVDVVGAGIGDKVLVTTGSAARVALDRENAVVDAAIIGIVDTIQQS